MIDIEQKPIFKSVMCETTLILYVPTIALIPLSFGIPPIHIIIIILIISYIWLAYTIRLFYVYDNGVKIVFPLRFKPIYKSREIFISYDEIKEIRLFVDRVETIRIISFRKYNFFRLIKNHTFFLWLDARLKKRNAILNFFKTKNIKIIIKPSWAKHYIS